MIIRFIFILFILFGCTTKTESFKEIAPINLKYKTKKIKSIDLENLDISLSYALQYPGSSLVYFTNFNSEKKLYVYSLNLENLKLNILLKISIDFQFEAYAINEQKSEIHIFTGDEMLIYNFNNEELSRETFGTLKRGYLSNQNPIGFYPYIQDNTLFIEYFPNIQETYKSKLFYRQPFQGSFNLNTSNVELLGMTYPKEYQEKCYGYNFIPDRIIGDLNQHVVTFPYNDSVYIYNKKGELQDIKYFGANSKHNFQFIPYGELKNLQQEVFDEFNKDMPHYAFSTYFSYSRIYCRQLISYDEESKKSNSIIIFYDSEWNYLGEFSTIGTMSLFDSKKFGLLKIQKNKNNLEIYEFSI